MARHSRSWRIGLGEDLRDPDFVRAFRQAAKDEGVVMALARRTMAEARRAVRVRARNVRPKPGAL